MRQGILTFGLAAMVSGGVPLFAHEGHAHKYMGKVVAVDAQRIEVETKDGTKVGAPLTPDTQYLRGKATATFADVKVGERVVISVVEEKVGDKAVKKVTQVLLGETAAPAAKPPQH